MGRFISEPDDPRPGDRRLHPRVAIIGDGPALGRIAAMIGGRGLREAIGPAIGGSVPACVTKAKLSRNSYHRQPCCLPVSSLSICNTDRRHRIRTLPNRAKPTETIVYITYRLYKIGDCPHFITDHLAHSPSGCQQPTVTELQARRVA